jgi:hypothetical protein
MAIAGILAMLIGAGLLGLSWLCTQQRITNHDSPNYKNARTNEQMPARGNQNSDAATENNRKPPNSEDFGFKAWIIANEKFLNAISTAFIAAFTVLLAFGTLALFFATINLVSSGEDTAKRQLRAYLGVGADDFSFDTPGEADPNYVPIDADNPISGQIFRDFLNVKVRNFGQTPALDVIVFSNVTGFQPFSTLPPDSFFSTGPGAKHDTIPTGNIRQFISRFTLQPGQISVSKHLIGDVRGITRARNQQESIYVWGRIYYRDIYNRPWRTRFCYVWEPWHPSGARFVPYEKYNGEDQQPFE